MTPMDADIADVLHYVVLFSAFGVVWFLFLFLLLPFPFGSPRDPETGMLLHPQLVRKAGWAAVVATPIWLAFYVAIRVGIFQL